MSPLEAARELRHKRLCKEAEEILNKAIEATPNDPDLRAERGMVYAFSQREILAVEEYVASAGSKLTHVLGQILADYFYCRSLYAKQVGVEDLETKSKASLIKEVHGDVSNTLSACLIVKNEEKHLDRCLSSLKGIVDEIVVIDTGSTDRTLEIAEKHGAVIGHFPWINDFSAARNASLDLATSAWALWIDADEELTPESFSTIREALIRPQFGGYYVQIINLMDDVNENNQYVHLPVRIFKNIPEIRFSGKIHEQVLPCFEKHQLVPATLNNVKLIHYGYRPSDMVEKDKVGRSLEMLEREVKENPSDSFQWFNLANVYSHSRRHEDCVRASRQAVKYLPPDVPYGPVAYQLLSSSLIALGRASEAVQVGESAKANCHFQVINQFEYSHALLKTGRASEALDAFEAMSGMSWPSDLPGDTGIISYKGLALKAQILVELGRYEEALLISDESLRSDANFAPAWYSKGLALSHLNQPNESAVAFEKASTGVGLKDCRILAAQQWRLSGQFEKAYQSFSNAFLEESNRPDLAAAWIQIAQEWGDASHLLAAYKAVDEAGFRSPEILNNWARTLAKEGLYNEAAEKFGRAIELSPSDPNIYFNFGDLLYSIGLYAEAAGCYEQGLRLNPQSSEGWFVLGNCFAQLDHTDGAQMAYRYALNIDPNHGQAQHNLALVA